MSGEPLGLTQLVLKAWWVHRTRPVQREALQRYGRRGKRFRGRAWWKPLCARWEPSP